MPANTDERVAADEVLAKLPAFTWVFGDKGFIGQDWQAQWQHQAIYLITPTRKKPSWTVDESLLNRQTVFFKHHMVYYKT